jgi:SAM-dependent methyltransferase
MAPGIDRDRRQGDGAAGSGKRDRGDPERSVFGRLLKGGGEVAFGLSDADPNEYDRPMFDGMCDWLQLDFSQMRVLDVGCWNAQLAVYLGEHFDGIEYVGLDFSLEALRVSRLAGPNVHTVMADVGESLPCADESFDTVFYMQTFEHLQRGQDRASLHRLRAVLKPGGHLVFGTQINSLPNFLDPAWYFGHRHYWPRHLREMLQEAGLEVRSELTNGGFWQMADVNLLYVWKHILRRKYRTPEWLRRLALREHRPKSPLTSTRVWFHCVRPG